MCMSTVAFECRMTPEQRESLRTSARERNVTMQELLELTVFNEVRPRQRQRHKPLGRDHGVFASAWTTFSVLSETSPAARSRKDSSSGRTVAKYRGDVNTAAKPSTSSNQISVMPS